MCYIRNETEPEGDLSYMSTTAKEWFDQMMERCENSFGVVALLAFAIVGFASVSFANEASAATNNCYARLVADVRMPVEPSVMVRMDRLSDRVSCLETKQAVSQDNQNGRLQKLETSLSRLDEVVDSRLDGRCEKKLGDLKRRADGFYEARYRELKEAHDRFLSWLSVCMIAVGFLVTIFGVVMPIVVSFHQHKSYENNLEDLHEKITAEREEAERILRNEVSKVREQNFVDLHYSVAENACRMSTMSLKEGELGNVTLFLGGVILGVHYVIECAMRVDKKDLLIKAIDSFEDFVKRWRDGDELHRRVWTSALMGLHTAITNDKMAFTKKDYVKLLGNDAKYLGWLESFYKDFADWKFA